MMIWMRKHMKAILIGVMILIIPMFVVWGGYRSSGRGGPAESEGPVAVATVGDVPIMSTQYRQQLRAELARRAQQTGGEMPSFQEAAADGTAERVLDGLIDSILVGFEVEKRAFDFDRDFLIDRLKEQPAFRDDSGAFDPTAWNMWLERQEEQNWNAIYADLADRAGRQVLLQEIMAPARVLDSDVRRQFEENFTKIQVKALKLDPPIEPTDEQIQAQYDEDPTQYQWPQTRDVEFVVMSLKPERPPLLDELVQRIRDGEDFAELAKQHSDAPGAQTNGGDMGWTAQNDDLPDNLKALFEIPVGTVSAPIEYAGAYFIYSVPEERINEQTGEREVKASQIRIRPELDQAERQAREEKADAFLIEARAAGDLRAAAEQAQLTVHTLTGVSTDSTELENVDTMDIRTFARGLEGLYGGDVSNVIAGRNDLYVAKITHIEPPVQRPLEEVREQVTEDTANAIRRSPERRAELKALGQNMADGVHSVEQLMAKYPDMNLELKETKDFTRRDFLWNEGLYVQAVDIFEAVGKEQPGTFAGPLQGFQGEAYFVELLKKSPPTDEDWENEWPEQEKSLRESALANKRNQLLMDYLAHLRERAGTGTPVQRNYLALSEILGTNEDTPAPAAPDPAAEQAQQTAEPQPEEDAQSTPEEGTGPAPEEQPEATSDAQ